MRGLPQKKVDRLLLDAVHWLDNNLDRPFNTSGRFSRQSLREYLVHRDRRITEHQANGLVDQMIRLDGVTDVSEFEILAGTEKAYQLPANAELLVRHRRWRLPSGRFNLADALQLLEMYKMYRPAAAEYGMTARLQETEERIKRSLKHIGVRV